MGESDLGVRHGAGRSGGVGGVGVEGGRCHRDQGRVGDRRALDRGGVLGFVRRPKATFDIPLLATATKTVVFASAAAALWNIGYGTTAVVFVLVLVANLMLIRIGHLAAPVGALQ
ncbi:hypothetical protein NONO_c04030 [Nocardia nova SH22a]|uniref:Uncharacterized protein n=1 Tax=Nocardia nova SH22a TaxID=1415166 RepID=W5TD98_9NOCA|nr:hypothetical protein [Nocardia nova]AHH15216.1 hypothetical protein NONO_c04030 [Nocardia nova SH22a]